MLLLGGGGDEIRRPTSRKPDILIINQASNFRIHFLGGDCILMMKLYWWWFVNLWTSQRSLDSLSDFQLSAEWKSFSHSWFIDECVWGIFLLDLLNTAFEILHLNHTKAYAFNTTPCCFHANVLSVNKVCTKKVPWDPTYCLDTTLLLIAIHQGQTLHSWLDR